MLIIILIIQNNLLIEYNVQHASFS